MSLLHVMLDYPRKDALLWSLAETDILQLAAVQGHFILSVCAGFHIERMFTEIYEILCFEVVMN